MNDPSEYREYVGELHPLGQTRPHLDEQQVESPGPLKRIARISATAVAALSFLGGGKAAIDIGAGIIDATRSAFDQKDSSYSDTVLTQIGSTRQENNASNPLVIPPLTASSEIPINTVDSVSLAGPENNGKITEPAEVSSDELADRVTPEKEKYKVEGPLIVLGDSIVAGQGLQPGERRWTDILVEKFPQLDIANLAVPGQTMGTENQLDSSPAGTLISYIDQISPYLSSSNTVLLIPSVNELHASEGDVQAAIKHLNQVVEKLKTNGVEHVIILPMPGVGDTWNNFFLAPVPDVNEIIEEFNQQAIKLGLVTPTPNDLLDSDKDGNVDSMLFDDYQSSSEIFYGEPDGLHPDADGHREFAKTYAEVLKKLIK